MIGQVRGFDLDQFLSDWEEPGAALPWAVGDSAWVKDTDDKKQGSEPCVPPAAPALDIPCAMQDAGISPILKVLFVPDYVPRARRESFRAQLWIRLGRLLPGYVIRLAISEGPFEDNDGIGAHFEGQALTNTPKQVALLEFCDVPFAPEDEPATEPLRCIAKYLNKT